MIVHNVTIKINPHIESEWLTWQKNEHIPAMMATNLFTECKFFRLLEQEESDGITYVMQYFCHAIEDYKKFMTEFAPQLQGEALSRWKNQFITFRTVMEIVN